MTDVVGRVCMLFSSSLLITTTDSLAVPSFFTIGSERLVSSPHRGHASTTAFSFFLGIIARWHFGQNCMMSDDRIALVQFDTHLTLPYFGENLSMSHSFHRELCEQSKPA